MFEVKLIKEVKKHPCIYDRNNPTYNDQVIRHKAWTAISKAILTPITQCKLRWKTLRERFVKDHAKMLNGDDETLPKWKFTDLMSFMSEYITNKKANKSFDDGFEYVISEQDFSSSCLDEEPCTAESMQSSTSYVEEQILHASHASHTSNPPAPKKRKEDTFSDAHKELTRMIETVGCILDKKFVASESRNDAFYKYLETLLGQVDEKTQDRIKIEIINLVSQRVLEE